MNLIKLVFLSILHLFQNNNSKQYQFKQYIFVNLCSAILFNGYIFNFNF